MSHLCCNRVPTSTGKMRRLFPVKEKSEHFEKCQKVRESQGIFREKSGKSVIHKLKFNKSRIKILLNFTTKTITKFPFLGSV